MSSLFFWRKLSRTQLILIAFFAVADACGTPGELSAPGAYVLPDGTAWAYGSVQLANLDVPGTVMLKRNTTVQPVNSSGQVSAAPYDFYGAIQATAASGGGERDLAYVDYHPTQDKVLAYNYSVEFIPSAANPNVVDIFADLLQPGRSNPNCVRMWLGNANFTNGQNYAAVNLADGLKLSLIADGVFTGQWALHFADIKLVVAHPWQGMCPRTVVQLAGQNLSQNPGQFDSCRPVPPPNDLCDGDPTQQHCTCHDSYDHYYDDQQPLSSATAGTTATDATTDTGTATATATAAAPSVLPAALQTDANLAADPAQAGTYLLATPVATATLIFVSTTAKAASDQDDATACANSFYAVARSADHQLNSACVLTPAPTSAQNGQLTCAVTIAFDQPQTYLERVCNVFGIFRGAQGDELQALQILTK